MEIPQRRHGSRARTRAAGDAVGYWLVQLAAAKGATVIATASAATADRLRRLGAAQVIDYRAQRFKDAGQFIAVFDLVGGETQELSWGGMKHGGRPVSTVERPAPEHDGAKGDSF